MTTPTPSNALVNVLAEWEDKNGTMAAIMPDEWAGLMRPVMNACMIQSPRQIRRELAAVKDFHNEFVSIHAEEIGKLNQLKADLAAAQEALYTANLDANLAVERAKAAEERAEQNAKDAEFGKILMRYIDRLLDPVPEDPLEKIVRELSAAIDAAMKEPK